MIIQVTTVKGVIVQTIPVDVATPMVLVLRPCFYCEKVLVKFPRKFCCASHKVCYCQKKIATLDR